MSDGICTRLGVLDQEAARLARLPKQKHEMTTRLDQKTAAKKDDTRELEAWKKAVRLRDGNRCRVCKRKLVVTLELQANRAECHHIRSRAHKPTRYDRRNGLLVCPADHRALERHELVIVARVQDRFAIDGEWYIDGDSPSLTFKRPEDLK